MKKTYQEEFERTLSLYYGNEMQGKVLLFLGFDEVDSNDLTRILIASRSGKEYWFFKLTNDNGIYSGNKPFRVIQVSAREGVLLFYVTGQQSDRINSKWTNRFSHKVNEEVELQWKSPREVDGVWNALEETYEEV